jgi:hypothetical protein
MLKIIKEVVRMAATLFIIYNVPENPSQWPRGLRRMSTAARLLRSWVRIPAGGMDVCLLCVVR